MGGSELDYVHEAFESNWIAPLGPNVTGFELAIQKYLNETGSLEVAALSSGTAALHLALILCGVERGDEVLCQSMTFSASANPIVYQGATPIFIDSEPDTWNLSPEHLERAIEDRIKKGKLPKAIIAVHLYGMPYKVDEVREIANRYEIPIIEDSAEALGSSYDSRKCGTFGDFSILSFNGNKIITTSGGGALISKTKELKEKAVFLATQARDTAPHYQHSEIGYNYRLSNIAAGIGRGQMEVLDSHVLKRRKNHYFYKKLFENYNEVCIFREPNERFYSNHWLSCVLVTPNKTNTLCRETVRLALDKEHIESRPLWKPMHLQPVFRDAPFYGDQVSEGLFDLGLCLPSGSNLTSADRERIKRVIDSVF